MNKSLLDFNSSMRRTQSSSGTVSDSQVAEAQLGHAAQADILTSRR